MNEKIFLHTINNDMSDFYRPKKQKETLEKILSSGKILSRRNLGYPEESFTNFSGMDYISLSDYEKRFVSNKGARHYNSYYAYVRQGLSISFPQESLKVIEPTIIAISSRDSNGYRRMYELGLREDERFTDLPDEVQVRDSIDVSKSNGIIFPTKEFMYSRPLTTRRKMIELMKVELDTIRTMLDKYNYDLSIYDVDTLEELNDDNILTLSK